MSYRAPWLGVVGRPLAALGGWWRWRVPNAAGLVALSYLVTIIGMGLLANVVSPHSYTEQNLAMRLTAPSWGIGSSGFLLGSDGLGRDVLSRIVHGILLTFAIPAAGVGIALVIGTLLGVMAGYYGRWLDALLMRLVDMMMGLSTFLLILVLVVLVGTGVKTLILVFGLANWVLYARVARGAVLSLKEMQYVQAARSIGCSNTRLMYAHIAPGLIAVVTTLAIVDVGRLMITEAGLSFLGFGVQPPAVT
jgi:peptide/nickel transport system permease protein